MDQQNNYIYCSYCNTNINKKEYKEHFEHKHVFHKCDICTQLVSISYLRAHISLHKI